MGRAARLASAVAGVVVLAAGSVACGDGDDGPAEASTVSSPFEVRQLPTGLRAVSAGSGMGAPSWGQDCCGTDEPMVVLVPDQGDGAPIIVTATGYAGYQGGLEQASSGYGPAAGRVEQTEVDGDQALFFRGRVRGEVDRPVVVELLVERGPDLAVRLLSTDGDRDHLAEISRHVEVSGPSGTGVDGEPAPVPTVSSAVEGYHVDGYVSSDALVALSAFLDSQRRIVPGPSTAHVAAWGSGGRTLVVQTIPGVSVDLSALRQAPLVRRWMDLRSAEVAGRDAVVDEGPTSRTLVTTTSWGDVLVVSSAGDRPESSARLEAIAASVRPIDDGEWRAFVDRTFGGPGLHADPGRQELARGRQRGVEWLLQTTADGQSVDRCLKLSNHRRTCTAGQTASRSTAIYSSVADRPGVELPPFLIVVAAVDGTTVRSTAAGKTVSAPFVPVGDAGMRAAVLFGSPSGVIPACDRVVPGIPVGRIEVLDAAGQVVQCLSPLEDATG